MPRKKAIPERIASCIVCGARDECVKASHLWGVRSNKERLRQVVLEIRYNKRLAPTIELEEGRIAHEKLEQMRNVEKNHERIVDLINQRSKPFYMTATFCSPTFGGLRCQPDAVYVEAKGDTLRLLVIEDKTSNQPRYYAQLYAEAVILTDRHCLVAPSIEGDHLALGGILDQERTPFYSQLEGFQNYTVDAAINPYGSLEKLSNRPLKPIHFSENFHIASGLESKYFIVSQSKKTILKALKHPQHIDEGKAQMRFTRRGKELKVYMPKSAIP